ncbi:EAL domain-containing protein [Allohahella marinimesophila]|uniref:PAS domain S-box-containing protein/diguanylate cyclase (GGDEF)-like protein n=1 Tax=Allohahella marinimesophila TaxID=1054972 RepID=A0ABP7NXN9_9GAMM
MYLRALLYRSRLVLRVLGTVTTLFFALSLPALAKDAVPLSIMPDDAGLPLGAHVVYQIDQDRNLAADEVRKLDQGWNSLATDNLNLGFTSDVVWLRFKLENDFTLLRSIYLDINYPLLDDIQFTLFEARTGEPVQFIQAGDDLPFAQRPIHFPNFVFPLALEPLTDYVAVMRIETTSAMQAPLTLWHPDALATEKYAEGELFGAIIGMIAIMALYNLFLWLSIRESAYFYYSLCLVGYSGVEASLTGVSYRHAWPNSPQWAQISVVVSAGIALFALAMFTHRFLKLGERSPGLGKVFYTHALLCLIVAALAFLVPYQIAIQLALVMVAVVALSTYAAGIYFWAWRRVTDARYLVIAFTLFTVFAVYLILSKFTLVPRTWLAEHAIHFGAISVVALLSFALADRINREKLAREQAQKNAIANLERYRIIHDESMEGRFQIDSKGRFTSANPALARIFGASSPDALIVHHPDSRALMPARREKLHESMDLLTRFGKLDGFEAECRRMDGSLFWVAVYGRVVHDPDTREPILEGSLVDITDRKAGEQKLNYLASHDTLTGLLNRLKFDKRLQTAILSASRLNDSHALLLMDLDQFKIVNDTCGHSAGDQLLKQIAMLFQRHIRSSDSLARLGGDEFAILLHDVPLPEAAETAQRLRQDVADYRFNWEDKIFNVGISIGVVPVIKDAGTVGELLSLADTACYAAKDAGRNRVFVHDEESGEIVRRQNEMELVAVIREAISNDDLILYHQKIATVKGGAVKGERYELLVRMRRNGEILLPGAFLPAAERYNMIIELDRWVIDTYFRWLSENPDKLEGLAQANINLSGQSVGTTELTSFILSAFKRYNIPADKICFEITESAAVASINETQSLIATLRELGCRFALDDFGSGFASYGYLKSLPVTCLKIDGCFIRDLLTDPVDQEMVSSMTRVAHAMGLEVVAEYVETAGIMERLGELKVDYAQGWHIHKPELLVDRKLAISSSSITPWRSSSGFR